MAKQLKAFLHAITIPADRLVDEFRNIKENRDVSNAVGAQLKQIQKIVVFDTEIVDDDEALRTGIENEIIINNSEGDFDSIFLAIEKLTGVSNFRIDELGNANIRIHITNGTVTNEIYRQIRRVVGGGIGTYMTSSTGVPFVFLGGNGKGFGDINAGSGVGGEFSTYWKK